MALNLKFVIPTGRELFRSFKNARSEWKLKTPLQKWCYLYGIGRAPYRVLRMSLLNDVNKVHWFSYFAMVYATLLPLLALYTLCYYTYRGEPQMALPCAGSAFVTIGHYPVFLATIFEKRFKLQSLIDFGGKYIYHDSHKQTEYNRICSHHMDKTMKRYIIKMGIIFIGLAVALVAPMRAYIVHGIRSTTIEAHIPFTEPKSDADYICNSLLQQITAFHALQMYLGLELYLSILESTVTITTRLIKRDLVHTIRLYANKSITELELHLKFGNIVKQSIDADNYLSSLSQVFYWRNLFTTTAFTVAIATYIYCQYALGFVAGYGFAVMNWVQLYFICDVGETMQDHGFAEMLYQTKWETLPTNMQKVVIMLIHRKQNEAGLKLGPFGFGINREIFKESTNKIYTFVMCLRNFFY